MNHRDFFRFSLLSFTLLLYPFVHPADQRRDAGAPIPGAHYVGSLPNGHGTTEIAPTENMPKGPDINPQYNNGNVSNGSSSSMGGILGFFYNLTRPSAKEKARDAVIKETDRILWKAANNTPLTHEEHVFMGSASAINQPSIPVAAPTPIAPPTPTPTLVAPAPAPALSTPNGLYSAHIAGRGQPLPQVGSEADGMARPWEQSSLPSIPTAQQPSIIDKPNIPQFNLKNPSSIGGGLPIPSLNGSDNGNNGGGLAEGAAGLMAGGAYALSQAAAPTAATATTTTGGAVAGSGSLTATIGATAWYTVVLAGNALALGTICYGAYQYGKFVINGYDYAANNKRPNPNYTWYSSTPIDKLDSATKSVRNYTSSDVDHAMEKIEENYRYQCRSKKYELWDRSKPIKCTNTGKEVTTITFDGKTDEITAYSNGERLGWIHPETFEMYEAPIKKNIKPTNVQAKSSSSSSNSTTGGNGNGGPRKDDDKRRVPDAIKGAKELADELSEKSRKQILQESRHLTNKKARELVNQKLIGYEEKPNPPFDTHGGIAFYNKKTKTWISPDQDGHNGGVWKMFNRSGDERLGTFNDLLTKRIKS